jgi:polyisoprenoid-binding protein YceI
MKSFYATTISTLALLSTLTSVSAETAKPGEYMIDPAHTTVTFSVNHLGTSNLVGRFNTIEGNFTLTPKGNSKVEVIIDTASVDTNHEKRDIHLRSPDFFNAKQYPKMKFTSTKVHFNNGELGKIDGKLSLHGKTHAITLIADPVGAGSDPWGGYRAGYLVTTVIKRSDYGMDFMQGGIGDDIKISLNIEAIKQ